MKSEAVFRLALRHQGSTGLSAMGTALKALMPKCPLCWMALMSALGIGWYVSPRLLHPITETILLVPLGVQSYRVRRHGPVVVGVMAAAPMTCQSLASTMKPEPI